MSQLLGSKTYVTSDGSVPVLGVTDGSSAAAGYVGEYIEAVQFTPTNFAATTIYTDLGSITLTAGDWDISVLANIKNNSAGSLVSCLVGIGTAAGNSSAGLVDGDTQVNPIIVTPSGTYVTTCSIPNKRVKPTVTTTYYMKIYGNYASGTPQYVGRISARRVR